MAGFNLAYFASFLPDFSSLTEARKLPWKPTPGHSQLSGWEAKAIWRPGVSATLGPPSLLPWARDKRHLLQPTRPGEDTPRGFTLPT